MLRREFRHSLSRFLAIFAIVALGVGFLAGLLATTPDMRYSADQYYDDTNMMDIRLVSTMGFTEEDIAEISGTEGVDQAMPAYSADMLLTTEEGDTKVAKVQSLPLDKVEEGEYQNQVILVEGRMPEKAGECVLEVGGFLDASVPIGGTLTISEENESPEDKLAVEKFTVVGTVKSAYYFSIEKESSTVGSGTVQLILYTGEESFSYEVYTDVFTTVTGAKELEAFTQEYDDRIQEVAAPLEELADVRAEIRYEDIKAQAEEELAQAEEEFEEKKASTQQELEDAWAQIEDAQEEIDSGSQELEEGRRELESSKQELAAQREQGYATLEEQRGQLDSGSQELADQKAALEDTKAQLDAVSEEIEQLRPYVDYDEAIAAKVKEYDAAVAAVTDGLAQIESGEAEIQSGYTQLDQAEAELASRLEDAQAQIDQGEKTLSTSQNSLDQAKKELETAKREYEERKAEAEEGFAEGEGELQKAREEIDALEKPEWYVLDRHSNLGYESFDSNAEKVAAIAKVFPIFFFLVAALVALTTMTRMVEEERIEIGTMKALGYRNGQIAFKYLFYAGAASVLGSAFGLLVGFQVFPIVIWNAYKMMYTLPPLITQFNVKYAVLSSAAAILCTLAATFSACRLTLKEKPAALMLPRAPKAGKRVFLEYITPLWKRLKFTHKVTARNLIRYKKRFFMTTLGVAGCTALLLTGFGLHDSINDIVARQFNDLFQYNLAVGLKEPMDTLESSPLADAIEESGGAQEMMLFSQENVTVSSEKNSGMEATISVPQERERIGSYVVMKDRKTQEPVPFEEDGVVVVEKLAEQLGVSPGDQITLESDEKGTAVLTVTGITENYVSSYIYVSPQAYEKAYGEQPEYNMVLAVVPEADEAKRDEVSAAVLKTDLAAGVSFTDSIKESFGDLLSKIDYIVVVLIVSAAALAFVVLYNLTNINITERQKEIATLKVLGFYDREVSAYVYRETAILSLLGILFGFVFGIFLHAFVVRTAEVDVVMFGRNIYFLSYVYSALLTAFFTLLVSLVMNRKLKKIDMVESMKSNE